MGMQFAPVKTLDSRLRGNDDQGFYYFKEDFLDSRLRGNDSTTTMGGLIRYGVQGKRPMNAEISKFCIKLTLLYYIISMLSGNCVVYAQKGLIYDPEKGILFEDELPSTPVRESKPADKATVTKKTVVKKPVSAADLHVGRQKDPPDVYFKSGIEYFKNNDFENAFKNFHHADSVSNLPLYKLWKVKALRRIGNTEDMLNLLEVIIRDFSSSDIADDALLELAIYYKGIDEYEKASRVFTQLIEQYPFAVSASTGEELPVIAREQRTLIRVEMLNLLSVLGIREGDLAAGYKQFQKENGLPLSGTGARETVSRIKEKHARFMEQEELALEEKKKMAEYRHFTAIAFIGIFMSLLFYIVLHSKITHKRKHLIELRKALVELDIRKI